MIRRVIQIDEDKCTGCGICADACHEGAIAVIDGKAKLTRDDYCDGMGDCLPACPADAIHFVEREAAAYDAEAVKAHREGQRAAEAGANAGEGSAPVSPDKKHNSDATLFGALSRVVGKGETKEAKKNLVCPGTAGKPSMPAQSQLAQWPCQIKLVPVHAPFFQGAKLLIAADCTAYAYARMHEDFMRGRVTIIGCPKLDSVDYSGKLTEILRDNDIKSVTIVRMEVPCCGGLERAAVKAMQNSGKFLPWQVVTISTDGRILDA